MKMVVLNHRVADYPKWKAIYDADIKRRSNAGLRELKVGTKKGDPNLVYMVFEAQDTADFEKMANDPELEAVMKDAGVISKPEILIID